MIQHIWVKYGFSAFIVLAVVSRVWWIHMKWSIEVGNGNIYIYFLHWRKSYLIFHIYGLKTRQIFLSPPNTRGLLCIAQHPLQVHWSHVTHNWPMGGLITAFSWLPQWPLKQSSSTEKICLTHSSLSGKWEAKFRDARPLRHGGYLLLQRSLRPWLVHPAFCVKARFSCIPCST